jgi:hypothetical protein
MTKARPRRDRTEPEIDELSWRFLCDATTPEDEAEKNWHLLTLRFDEKELAVFPPPTGKSTSQLWAEFREQVLEWWLKERPGTRPWCWWRFDAPERRRRVGGTGTTYSEFGNRDEYTPDFGLPTPRAWLTGFEASSRDVEPFDPANPPIFEAEAVYLKRLGLFLPGEEKRLEPSDFEPEAATLPPPRISNSDIGP